MEPAELPPMQPLGKIGPIGRSPARRTNERCAKNGSSSLQLNAPDLMVNLRLQVKLAEIRQKEQRSAELLTDDARLIVVGFGTAGRIAETAVKQARSEGMKVGLLRPISLWPFPEKRLSALSDQVDAFLVVEMNAGQMLEDVRLAAGGQVPVQFVGRMGGVVPVPEEIYQKISTIYEKLITSAG
jgi:2-oxoglutarate ferredoxin oxidoreductase subunit alpha